MTEASSNLYVRDEKARIRTANPNLAEMIWEKLRGPQFTIVKTQLDPTTFIELESSLGSDGREIFSVVAGSHEQESRPAEDTIGELIETLKDKISDQDWQGVRQIGLSLLRDFGGRPGGMHKLAMESPRIAVLSELLRTTAEIFDTQPQLSEFSQLLRQAYRDLSLEASNI